MNNEGGVEVYQEESGLLKDLVDTVVKDERLGRKQNILRKMTSDGRLVEEFDAQLRTVEIEYQGRGKTIEDEARQLRGLLFEDLVSTQYGIDSEISDKLVSLIHDPERFRLTEQMGYLQNPDVAFVETDEEKQILIIKAVGEIKLGLLDFRSFRQLGSYNDNVDKLAKVLNSSDLADQGLADIAKAGRVEVADDFKVVLYIPADRDASNKRSLIYKQDFYRAGDFDRFVKILESPQFQVEESVFTKQEVADLASTLMGKIKERRAGKI